MLKVQNLHAGYGRVQVLWDVGLTVDEHEVVAIIGSNGAGKSTLLSVLSGLLQPLRGTIEFEGSDMTRLDTNAIVSLGLIHVPQGRRMFAGLTVRENLLQGAYSRRDPQVSSDLDEVLHLFPSLERRLSLPAGRLSGGEQQMVAIGRGIMGRPKLLMVDELSLGLAPIVVESILEALGQINRERGTALMIVEQDVQIALEHSHRGYVLESGRIVMVGLSRDLLRDEHIQGVYLGV